MYYHGTSSLKTWVVKGYEKRRKCLDKLRVYLDINRIFICDILRDLVPFVQFEKHEKHPLSSVLVLLKVTLLHECFSRFLNCINDTRSLNASHIQLFAGFYFMEKS